jgi:endonuclease-8
MPEGDTIHRAAARLRPALEGRPLVRFDAPRWSGPTPAPGELVEAVRAVGKHLLIDFSGGLTLRTHLRMQGRWTVYSRDERSRRSPPGARVIVEVPDAVAVCYSAPDVAITRRDRVATAHLGPDLCEPDLDLDEVLARARRMIEPNTTIGELLLDQRVASGIGNVYKSETLFAERLDPTTPVVDLTPAQLRSTFERAHKLLRANLGSVGRRRTVPSGYAVYRRRGRPCRVCGHPVERVVQGARSPRSTYYCAHCQVRPSSGD